MAGPFRASLRCRSSNRTPTGCMRWSASRRVWDKNRLLAGSNQVVNRRIASRQRMVVAEIDFTGNHQHTVHARDLHVDEVRRDIRITRNRIETHRVEYARLWIERYGGRHHGLLIVRD